MYYYVTKILPVHLNCKPCVSCISTTYVHAHILKVYYMYRHTVTHMGAPVMVFKILSTVLKYAHKNKGSQ